MIEQAADKPGLEILDGWDDPATPFVLNADKTSEPLDLPPEPTPREAALFLVGLVRSPAFLNSLVLLLPERAQRTGDWYVARRQDAPDGSHSLQVFVWPPQSQDERGGRKM